MYIRTRPHVRDMWALICIVLGGGQTAAAAADARRLSCMHSEATRKEGRQTKRRKSVPPTYLGDQLCGDDFVHYVYSRRHDLREGYGHSSMVEREAANEQGKIVLL
ncbi:hypothetical protein QOT17_007422 [Balamuthia mandrillaris]